MLAAFTTSLLLITVYEIGDKSFFIAMLLSMRHRRRFVFTGVVAALAVMTVLSVLLGSAIQHILPERYVDFAEIALFLGFGFKLLRDAYCMASGGCNLCEQKEAEEAVEHCEAKLQTRSIFNVIAQSFLLTFSAEWGDRTQFATIGLAASSNIYGVMTGSILGHAICAAIAVVGGRLIAGRISERTITAVGGVLFLVFAIVAGMEMA